MLIEKMWNIKDGQKIKKVLHYICCNAILYWQNNLEWCTHPEIKVR